MTIKARIALTGRPGVGKTMLIERLVAELGPAVGGMLTKEIRVCGHRVGFSLHDIATGREAVLAHIHQRVGPKVGRYTVNSGSLNEVGVPAILAALEQRSIVVIDEIAPMELTSADFVGAVEKALNGATGLIISTHAHTEHALAHRARQELELFRVKLSNRDELPDKLLSRFRGAAQ